MMLVDAARVPGLHLDAESVEAGAKTLRRDAAAVRDAGIAVSGAWQGLGACYETPETDQLLRALDPVRLAADKLADDLDAIAGVLDRFAGEIRSLQTRRSGLVTQIGDFRSRLTTDADGLGLGLSSPLLGAQLTGEPSAENTRLIRQSLLLGEEFESAERECANKITAIGSPATLLEAVGSWFQDTAAGFTTAVTTGWSWTTEKAEDLAGWIGERDMAIRGSWTDVGEAFGLFPDALAGTADDPRPQLTRVGAAYLQTLGALLDAGVTTTSAGIWDMDLAGDGEPEVGTPLRYDKADPLPGQRPERDLNSVADVLWSVTDSYETNVALGQVAWHDRTEGYVRVTKVTPPGGGPPRMVVSIPGTQPWFPWDDVGNEHPADFIGDLVGAAGGRSTYSDTVAMAIDEVIATDPDFDNDSPILLAGHSLGGITAADLASDPGFLTKHNVTDVVTAGSPIDNNRIDDSIYVLEIDHEDDSVSDLDFADLRFAIRPGPGTIPTMPFHIEASGSGHTFDTDRHTKITLPNPPRGPGEISPVSNHNHRSYGESVQKALLPGTALFEHQERIRATGGYLDPDAQSTVYDVPVSRK